jgi:hypothetical protein
MNPSSFTKMANPAFTFLPSLSSFVSLPIPSLFSLPSLPFPLPQVCTTYYPTHITELHSTDPNKNFNPDGNATFSTAGVDLTTSTTPNTANTIVQFDLPEQSQDCRLELFFNQGFKGVRNPPIMTASIVQWEL